MQILNDPTQGQQQQMAMNYQPQQMPQQMYQNNSGMFYPQGQQQFMPQQFIPQQ